jgi:hypothetical protein
VLLRSADDNQSLAHSDVGPTRCAVDSLSDADIRQKPNFRLAAANRPLGHRPPARRDRSAASSRYGGLDIHTAVAGYPQRGSLQRQRHFVTSKVNEVKLGIKTHAGLFDYTRENVDRLARERVRLLVASKKALTG